MGNSQTVLRVASKDADPDQVCRQLLRRYPGNGDTSILRTVRTSSDGVCARRRLEAHCEALRQYWDGATSRKASGEAEQAGANCQALLRQFLDSQNNKGETALALAASLGQVDAVRFLLEQGANLWLTDRLGGRHAIHRACLNAKKECVKVLLEHLPVDERARYLEATTISGFTPLHCAAASGDVPTLKVVLAHKPNLLPYNQYESYECGMEMPAGATPAHIAAAKGHINVAKELLRQYHGLGPDARGRNQDPRLARNSEGLLPWQVAYNVHIRPLAEMLHPSVPLSIYFAGQSVVPTLQALASAALQRHLLKVLDNAEHPQQHEEQQPQHRDSCDFGDYIPKHSSHSATLPVDIGMRPRTRLSYCGKECGRPSSSSPGSAADSSLPCSSLQQPAMQHRGQGLCSSRVGSYMSEAEEPVEQHAEDACGVDMAKGARNSYSDWCSGASIARPLPMRPRSHLTSRLAGQAELACKEPAALLELQFGSNEEEEGESPQLSACDICMDADARMELAPCAHRLCVACARRMVQDMKHKPVDCPFCRGHIASFVAVA